MVPAAARRTIWNVPHNRNPLFTGREELLAQIPAALQSGQPAALTQTLSGLGGVGKTQLAVEYAYRHASEYTLVWWLRAEEPTTLTAEYARLAEALDLPEKDAAEQAVAIGAVRRWLERNDGWLLIFDNANEPQDVQPYRPRSGSGHVLITSRSQGWRGMAQPLSVQELPREEAVEFLLRRTGQTDADSAAMLADALGDLPLALEQAGAYIDAMSISLAEYLQLFESYQVPLLDEALPTDYPLSITRTWDLAFQQVQQHSPAAADLLHLCAFLAPDNIPLSIIRDGAKYLPESLASAVGNPLELNRAIRALLRYSLVERQDDLLSVHRMVQSVTRARLDDEGRKLWVEIAVRVMRRVYPFRKNSVDTWEGSRQLLSHAVFAIQQSNQIGLKVQDAVPLLDKVARYLSSQGRYEDAKMYFQQAMVLGENVFDGDDLIFHTVMNNFGIVLRRLGDIQEAFRMFESSLAIAKANSNVKPTRLINSLENMGIALTDLGRLAEARKAYDRALSIINEKFEPDHPKVAVVLNNIGLLLLKEGNVIEAKKLFERALSIDIAKYGADHLRIAIRLKSLGDASRASGELDQAREYYDRALQIRRRFLQEDHPNTISIHSDLEAVIRQQQEQGGE